MQTETTEKVLQVKVVLLGQSSVGKSSLVLRFVQDKFFPNTEGIVRTLLFQSYINAFLQAQSEVILVNDCYPADVAHHTFELQTAHFTPHTHKPTPHPLTISSAAFLTKTLQLEDDPPKSTDDADNNTSNTGSNNSVKFEIWDTAGQERYHSLAPMYYRGAQAAIVVYDITSRDSFERAKQWVQELHDKNTPGAHVYLCRKVVVCVHQYDIRYCLQRVAVFDTFYSDQVIAFVGNKSDLANRQITTQVKGNLWLLVLSLFSLILSFHSQEAEKYATEQGLVAMDTSALNGNNVEHLFRLIASKVPKSQWQHQYRVTTRLAVNNNGNQNANADSGCKC
jgi:Ras-related protein Rab-5C